MKLCSELSELLSMMIRNFIRLLPLITFAIVAMGMSPPLRCYLESDVKYNLAVDSGRIIAPNTLLGPSANNTLTLEGTETDTDKIASTVRIVNQKSGVPLDASPDQPPPPTSITAIDGELTNNNSTISRRFFLSTRSIDNYEVIFQGTGTGPNDRDGSIEGTAYLTFTVLPNTTYDVPGCLSFCDHVSECGEYLNLLSISR